MHRINLECLAPYPDRSYLADILQRDETEDDEEEEEDEEDDDAQDEDGNDGYSE